MIHFKFLGTCLIFWKMCVVYCWLRKKKSLISCCWPLYPWFYVFLNPDGENRKGVDPHFMEFLPNQFFSRCFLRVNCTSCEWRFQIVRGNIFVIVAFRLMLGVLAVLGDCVYLVCHLCLSPAEGLPVFCCSSAAPQLLCSIDLKKGIDSFSGRHFQVLVIAGRMPLGFLGLFSQLKSCTDTKAPLFQGQIWAFPGGSGSRVYSSSVFPGFWCKCLDPPHLSQMSLHSLFHLFPGPGEYSRGENSILQNPADIPGNADARRAWALLFPFWVQWWGQHRGAGGADEEDSCGIPTRNDAQHTSTAPDPMEPLGLCWHKDTHGKPQIKHNMTALPLCAITQHREQPVTPSVMLRHQSQISTSFMEGFMYWFVNRQTNFAWLP